MTNQEKIRILPNIRFPVVSSFEIKRSAGQSLKAVVSRRSPRHLIQVLVRELTGGFGGYDQVVLIRGRFVYMNRMALRNIDPHFLQRGLGIGFEPGLELLVCPRLGD